jgi:serine/threonine protein kinase/transcription elongation factor Elf1
MVEDASLLMLGTLSVEKALITSEQLKSALDEQDLTSALLGEILVKRKLITRNQLKVLLDIHNLKLFYRDSVKFGELAIANNFVSEDQLQLGLELQKKSSTKMYIGEVLVQNGFITALQRDAILKSQKRLTNKKEDQEHTFMNCPFCEQSYSIVDPDRYRKVRCRHCHLIFEVGISKHDIINSLDFTQPITEEKAAIKKTESNDLHRLSSFLEFHKIDTGLSLEGKSEKKAKIQNKKYVFGNEIARGGMGAIVETFDTDIKREVVTKILLRNDSKEAIVKFIEEAQITGQLEHPNIVPVYDLGINDEDLVYFTMKRVRGETLLRIVEKIRKKDPVYLVKYPLDVLIEIIVKVCDGVAFAHQKGVLHRDLKPENIMVGEFGEVLTMDWGLAKVLGKDQATEKIESLDVVLKTIRNDGRKAKTIEGTIAGTPEYMSPEQAKGQIDQLTVRSDVYSLGAVLFTILAHKLPVEGKTHQETLKKVIKGDLNEIPEDASPELTSIVYKAMEYEPEDRYTSVNEFKEDLINYLRGFSVSAKEDTFFEQSVKFVRRNLFLSLGAVSLAVVMMFSIVIFLIMVNGKVNDKLKIQNAEDIIKAKEEANILERKLSAPALLDAAVSFVNSKKYEEASEKIKLVLEFAPELPDTYYYKGLIEIYREEYANAYQSFNVYENKIVYQVKTQYPIVRVNGMIKNLDMIQKGGLNTINLFEIKKFLEENKFSHLAGITGTKFGQLVTKYENIVYAIDPKVELKLKAGGVVLSLEKVGANPRLGELTLMPITEINLENSDVHHLNFINKKFLKKLILNGCELNDFHQISTFQELEWLEIADTNVKSISFLKDLKLKVLNLANCSVADLSPIENHLLTNLDVTGLPINDLEYLRKMPLTVLRMGNTRVWSLEPLQGKSLEWLSIWQTGIKSLKDIKGQPIIHLDIENTLITDLSDLIGSRIERINLDSSCIDETTIGVINQLHLKTLSIRGFKEQVYKNSIEKVPFIKLSSGVITEINKHYFKNVIELDISQCPKLQSIKGFSTLLTLEKIDLPGGMKNVLPLTNLPKLKQINTPEFGLQATSTFFQLIKVP